MTDYINHGRPYRFEIDDYFQLHPYPKHMDEFRGKCPITGKQDGLILIEYPLQVQLPFLGHIFEGERFRGVFNRFMKFVEEAKQTKIVRRKKPSK